ncbi:SusC/RagA family TonB-linked outer membrane protein [Gemmatimonadetes bacterium T265]|nr:SusC/RagA family TonB-linked outer membrane protein [Gemmatimonadetes bacterium T265]
MPNAAASAARAAGRLGALAALALLPGAALVAPVHAAAAQQPAQGVGRVAGTVLGTGGQPVSDVQVVVTTAGGARVGAVTNAQGRYNVGGVPAGTAAVRTQRIGFQPRTETVQVAAGQVTTLDFQLATSAAILSEVRVQVGYTNESRRQVTGAVSTVTGNEVQDQKVATIEESIRGRVPGVQVAAGGQPGRPADITIRGPSSLTNTSPLYVVDGMYVGNQNPNINPDDIATFQVLKDASAAAQYGSQASSGVIVITTRRGQAGQNQFGANAYYGFQSIPKTMPMAGAAEFQRVFQTAYRAAGVADSLIPSGVLNATGVNTDWQSAVMRNGAIQNYNAQASGGTPTASYLISGSVLNQDGTIINTNFRRASLRVNSDATRGRIHVGENIAVSQARQQNFPNGIFGGTELPLIDVVQLPPTIPVRDPNNPDGYGYGSVATPNYGTNPVAAAESNYNTYRSNSAIGSAFAEANLFAGLKYRLNVGVNYADSGNTVWNSSNQLRYLTPVLTGAFLRQSYPRSQQLLYENLLTYDGTFGGTAHRLTAVAGQTSQNNSYQQLTAYRQGFPNEQLQQISAGSSTGSSNDGFTIPVRENSLLARATYSFRDRYLATGTVRRDCSSLFSPSNRCGVFGSGSLGYVVSDEQFFKAIPLIGGADLFKLRVSTGVLGGQALNPFQYLPVISQNINYYFNGTITSGAIQQALINENLRWQRNRNTDVGFDLGLFNNTLSVTADYYQATLDQLLVQTAIPPDLASNANPTVNAGRARNAGFELGATHQLQRGDFRLNTTLSVTTLANRVLSLGNGGQPLFAGIGGVARTTVGQPIGEFYLLKNCGIFQSSSAIQAHTSTVNGKVVVLQPGAQPGDVCYQDVNGDGVIDNNDRYNAGTPFPKLQTGLFFNSSYKSFDVGVNLRGSFGSKIYNVVKLNIENTSGLQNIQSGLNYWSPSNTSGTVPRAVFGTAGAANFNPLNDMFLESGNFVRIQNIVVGYTLPNAVTRQLRLNTSARPRIYANVQNVATITKYSGYDPEVVGFGDPLARGVDDGFIYPNPRTVTFGFDVRF